MLRDRIEDKGRVPVGGVGGKRVRVLALQQFNDHEEGDRFEMAEGRELEKMITLGWVRIDDSNDAGA